MDTYQIFIFDHGFLFGFRDGRGLSSLIKYSFSIILLSLYIKVFN